MKRIAKLALIASVLFIAAPLWLRGGINIHFHVGAEPSFARRYNAKCTLCHTTYPRLNRTGYQFKRLGYRFPREVEAKGTPPAASAPGATQAEYKPMTDSARSGQKLYRDKGCASCHAIGGAGGKVGPALDGFGARRSQRWIEAHITNPQLHAQQLPGEHAGESAMAATKATSEQIAQITDYLRTLPAQEISQTDKWRLPDYFGISYAPGIEWENSNGETDRTVEKRELVIYAAGPIGSNFSFFVQPLPASEEKGLGGKFEMAQGQFNYGGARNFFQARFGQLFNLRNAGFGGTDRGFTETLPFIFQAVNGFNPAGLGRGVSLEYTLRRATTFKVFGSYNEAVETEAEGAEPVPEFRRSRTGGFVFEQVLGKNGLSGVQFEFASGRTPFLVDDVSRPSLRFQRYSFFANKTFVDSRSFERVNAIAGMSFLRDNQFLDIDSDRRSRGYGYFVEVDTIPVVNHLSLFARYDQLRPTTLASDNTLRGGTVGVIYDFVKYARMSFEYQRLDNGAAVNRYRLGWQFNF